jgi:DNA-binding PadR family transcriptional regulator
LKDISSNINAALTSIGNNEHVLHLYSPNINKHAIQTPFLAITQKSEKAFYISSEEPNSILKEFRQLSVDVSIISLENISKLDIDKKLRLIFDAGSIYTGDHLQCEEYLSKINNCSILCTYDISKLNPEIIKRLVKCHDRLILTTDDVTILSSENIGNKSIERFVKNYLDMIVLALILDKPMCGTDVMKVIHKNFNVLLSPGTVYLLLHALEENRLLECEYNIKKKIYRPVEGEKAEIRNMLKEHILSSRFLNEFLRSVGGKQYG